MSPSTNTRSRSKTFKEKLAIFPTTSPTSPSLSKYDLDNIQNDIKSMTDKNNSDMKALNNHNSPMLEKLTDTSSKTDKKEEKLTEISSKLSIYGDRLEKLNIKETQILPMSLQIT